jgi:peptidyl-prolyl cis-trans isomerase B (cyclophilin B)
MGKLAALLAALALALASAPAQAGPDAASAKGNKMFVLLTTTSGKIVLELDPAAAPETVANFVQYVQDGHYNGTIFHRVIPGFMIQGGGMDEKMKERPTRPPIKNEARNGLSNDIFTVAMARTSDPHSATAQFFINTKKNDFLNFSAETPSGWGYAVFGVVRFGMPVVEGIEKVPTTGRAGHDDVPVSPVIIEKAEVVSADDLVGF